MKYSEDCYKNLRNQSKNSKSTEKIQLIADYEDKYLRLELTLQDIENTYTELECNLLDLEEGQTVDIHTTEFKEVRIAVLHKNDSIRYILQLIKADKKEKALAKVYWVSLMQCVNEPDTVSYLVPSEKDIEYKAFMEEKKLIDTCHLFGDDITINRNLITKDNVLFYQSGSLINLIGIDGVFFHSLHDNWQYERATVLLIDKDFKQRELYAPVMSPMFRYGLTLIIANATVKSLQYFKYFRIYADIIVSEPTANNSISRYLGITRNTLLKQSILLTVGLSRYPEALYYMLKINPTLDKSVYSIRIIDDLVTDTHYTSQSKDESLYNLLYREGYYSSDDSCIESCTVDEVEIRTKSVFSTVLTVGDNGNPNEVSDRTTHKSLHKKESISYLIAGNTPLEDTLYADYLYYTLEDFLEGVINGTIDRRLAMALPTLYYMAIDSNFQYQLKKPI